MAARRSTKSRATTKAPARKVRKPKRDQMAATGPYPFHEGMAIALGGVALMLFLALVSYTPFDLPSWVPFSSTAGRETTLTNFIGPVGAVVAGYSYFFFGAASYLIPAVLAWWGIQVLTGARPFHGRNIAALAILAGSGACLIEYQTAFFQEWPARYNLPNSAGGFIGFGIGRRVLEEWLIGTVGAFILMSVGYFISVIIITGLHPFRFALLLKDRISEKIEERQELATAIARGIGIEGMRGTGRSQRNSDGDSPGSRAKRGRGAKKEPAEKPEPVAEEMELPLEPALPKPKIIDASMSNRKRTKPGAAKPEDAPIMASSGSFENYKIPSLALLNYGDDDDTATPTDKGELLKVQNTIIETLATFGVDVSPGDITKGPTITRYELYPSPGLRVNRITSLEADLARATRAERINILAPIPGKDTVGIEIANSDKVLVALRELFEDDAFTNSKKKIPLALGKDVYGRTIVGDLAQMPHLLVAGATGSGKSVCINSIVASLLYRFTPDQLRFIMIDPKVVEMQLYNALPHMVVPVVTDPKKVLLALRWVVNEMEKRYKMFAKLGCRNFDGFNSRNDAPASKAGDKMKAAAANAKPANAAADAKAKGIPKIIVENDEALADPEALLATHPVRISDAVDDPGDELKAVLPNPRAMTPEPASDPETGDGEEVPEHLPYIVVIIDELADLMQTAPADVETAIARIAQKARAAGIHLIVATQTPRADVVTGIIKANIPSRIAFQVSSKIDSRVILDAAGADRLVGKGDMLYLPPGSSQLIRAQGALIEDEEIQKVVEYCSKQGEPRFEAEIHQTLESGGESDEDEVSDADEEVIERCLEVIYQEKKASTSLLQRRLRLGYTRAARMIDIMEARGIIGPGDGAKPREILVDLSDDLG